MKIPGVLVVGLMLATPALAQTSARTADVRQEHYQIGVMERVLEGAVEHGAANFRERLQAVFPDAPAQLMILDNPRVRGFRLDGYGLFFDVEVPSSNGTLLWSLRTLDRGQPAAAPPAVPASSAVPRLPNPRRPAGAAASAPPDRPVTAAAAPPPRAAQSETQSAATPDAPAADEQLLENPNGAYRQEVVQSLADAMLDYSGPLSVSNEEWITVAARGIQDRPRIAPADNDGQTVIIRVRGADLSAFRAGQMSRDDVMRRIEKRVF
jgi:hypothetical protein